ncbi:TMV resistance protein N-like [Prunus avium]|uniref:ADP-ribosyl cyclase/cyclic ADP-ribose hydrolase n=1 Tax=Prunus avium TaxID=42229 RepID=A0A6P5R601_PRUAV|nr:TMV resistance protein N-like [Prunus avium]XP_021800415.1 TMV resistance protein N-like [Prunus avium]
MALSTKRDSAFRPSPDQSDPQWNHDVFLSFRGEDTRLNFVSHLYHELQLRGIKTFKDNPKLERGTPISSGLFNAIQESRLAIVVLSPSYASSTWCLDELTEILQCMKSKGTILPLFYNVDPSHVRKQSGSFAGAFAEHEERFREDIERVKSWRAALAEVANLSGIDSKNECERKLIEKIVEWVWSKMHRTFKLLDSTELVGIKFTLEQIDLLLAPTDDVRFIGIWGMGGIGKTTIAKLVYESISINFEVSCLLANVREVSEHGNLVNLQRQLLLPLLKEQITQVWDEQWGTYYIKNCLCNKKVLLILDDVNESSQLEKIAGKKDWFGKGSIMIITTRDERLLVKHDMQVSYKVEGLGDDDALELFSRNAFKKNEPEEGFFELSKSFVDYARGLPLALKLLGCLVYKRDQDEWKSELDKLQKIPKSEIIDLLKISYDGLDEMNKDIFLDVAFFHKGKDKEHVIEIVDICGLCGRIGIDALVQKSLLTISNGNVQMHDLIQKMAWEIVHRECPDEPGRRSRLCNHDDISRVFINNTATDKIKGIRLRMATLQKANWNCKAFSKMLNLKFLEFDNVMISSSPKILPNSLRSIKWDCYPSKFLPSGFQPNFLIALEMPESKLVRLWDGRKDLPNLKKMDLRYSKNLTRTPDFSGMPNLELLDFQLCDNLVEIHPSIADLKCLKSLDLGCCSKLKKIPKFSGQMKNLSLLSLQHTSIEKLSSSIGCLVGLTHLFLDDCKNLAGLPSEICNLKSLKELYASECSKIDKLPENMGEMESLTKLQLYGTSIRQLPRSVVGLKKLDMLDLGRSGSQPNKSRFLWGLSGLYQNRNGLLSLKFLNLSNRGLCEGDLPSDIGCLSSLEALDLSGSNFVSLPASIGCLSKLELFRVNGCQSLEQLPDLSNLISLVEIDIAGCTSLKMLPHLSSNCTSIRFRMSCANCFVLVDNEGSDSIILKMLQRYLQLIPRPLYRNQFEIVTPGREIPEWFSNQSLGDSVTVELPLDSCTTWMGIALCAAFEVQADLSEFHYFQISCPLQGMRLPGVFTEYFKIGDVVSNHLWVIYVSRKLFEKICRQTKVFFTTYYSQDRIRWEKFCVKKCGFRLVHEQDVEQLNQIMMKKSIIKSTTTCPTKSADAQGQQRHDDDREGSPSGSGSSHQKSLFCNTYALSEEADQDELNDVVDEARPRKRKKIEVIGTDL